MLFFITFLSLPHIKPMYVCIRGIESWQFPTSQLQVETQKRPTISDSSDQSVWASVWECHSMETRVSYNTEMLFSCLVQAKGELLRHIKLRFIHLFFRGVNKKEEFFVPQAWSRLDHKHVTQRVKMRPVEFRWLTGQVTGSGVCVCVCAELGFPPLMAERFVGWQFKAEKRIYS